MTYNYSQCPKCPYGGLDLSVGLFDYFTWAGMAGSSIDPGVLIGSWSPVGSGGYTPPSNPSGPKRIHPNGNSQKCLDVVSANFANGTPVDM